MSEEISNTNEVAVTDLSEADVAPIGEMHLQSWIETYQNPDLGVDEAWIRKNLGFLADSSGTEHRRGILQEIKSGSDLKFYKVVKDANGHILGFAMASRGEQVNEIDALYLLKSIQGKGLGTELLQQMLSWLGDDKPTKLEVVTYNNDAINFYKEFGFEVKEGSNKIWKDPVTAFEMVRPSHE